MLTFELQKIIQVPVRPNNAQTLVPPFFKFLFTSLFSIKISLIFHLFFLYLTCSCPYSCNLMLTATYLCKLSIGIKSIKIKKFYLKSVHFVTINISSQELFKLTCIINYIN